MHANLANGGLISKVGNKLWLTDTVNFTGTVVLDTATGERTVLHNLMWFMNSDGRIIYFSDQRHHHTLSKLDIDTLKIERLADHPCYALTRHGEWLYYIREDDRKLYRRMINGKKGERLTEEQVLHFLIDDDQLYYATSRGIRTSTIHGNQTERIADFVALRMIKVGDRLAFADKQANYALTVYDMTSGHHDVFEEITPISLNTDGRYIYCSNQANDQSLYRLDLESGNSIRIYGEKTEYLHIFDHSLYFFSCNEWFSMVLPGGQTTQILTLS